MVGRHCDPHYVEKHGTGIKEGLFDLRTDAVDAVASPKAVSRLKMTPSIRNLGDDIAKREKLGAKPTPLPANVRTLGHRVANEIIRQLTGKDAPFNTRFSVVNDRSGSKEIYIMDFDDKHKRITRNGEVNQPQWSPDDNRLAFTLYEWKSRLVHRQPHMGRITRLSARDGVNIGARGIQTERSCGNTLSKWNLTFIVRCQHWAYTSRLTQDRGIDVAASTTGR